MVQRNPWPLIFTLYREIGCYQAPKGALYYIAQPAELAKRVGLGPLGDAERLMGGLMRTSSMRGPTKYTQTFIGSPS